MIIKTHIQNIALVVLSIIFALYLGEFILGKLPVELKPLNERIARAQEQSVPYDTRTRFEVVEELRKNKKNAWPSIHLWQATQGLLSRNTDLYPLAGLPSSLTVFGNESGQYVTYISDEHGFNNPPGKYEQKLKQIALIGDSFVQGAYVQRPHNIAGLMNAAGLNAINFGIVGAGPIIELAIIKEYLYHLKPTTVFWFYYEENDLPDLQRERRFPLLRKYLEGTQVQNLFHKNKETKKFLEGFLAEQLEKERKEYKELKEKVSTENSLTLKQASENKNLSAFLTLRKLREKMRWLQSTHFLSRENSPNRTFELDLFRKVLSTANETVGNWKGKFYFVYLPGWHRYSQRKMPKASQERQNILNLVADLDIPCIDIHSRFSKEPSPAELFPFGVHGHYTKNGYGIVFDVLKRILEQNMIDKSTNSIESEFLCRSEQRE